ncbi:hypothetical protein KBD08_01540 [Candidatus Babeliales bacterium]|nr:hypothetical protein [Candidatus Babeliales bacterium]
MKIYVVSLFLVIFLYTDYTCAQYGMMRDSKIAGVDHEVLFVKSIFAKIEDNINVTYRDTELQLRTLVKNMQKQPYSKQHSSEFIKSLNNIITGFRYQVSLQKKYAFIEYFGDLDQENNVLLRQDQNLFVKVVDEIVQEAIVRMEALGLALTSQISSSATPVTLNHNVFDSSLQSGLWYGQMQQAHQQAAGNEWWSSLQNQANVNSLFKTFKDEYSKALHKEINTQANKFIQGLGLDVAKLIGQGVGKIIPSSIPALNKQLQGLQNMLEKNDIASLMQITTNGAVLALKKAIRLQSIVYPPKNPVKVRENALLCDDEKLYIKNRTKIVQKVLREEFGIDKPLRIAFCCSGGGNRAMVGTLGILLAAARSSFLQASMYCAGLSGSTWTISTWAYLYSKGYLNKKNYETSLLDMQKSFDVTLDDPSMMQVGSTGWYTVPLLDQEMNRVFAAQLVERYGYSDQLSIVDIWGASIGNYTLNLVGPDRLQVCWSELRSACKQGLIPLPLCSAAFDTRSAVGKATEPSDVSYDFFETGPFEAGSTVLGYVPIQYMGCQFAHGMLQEDMMQPEYPLSFWQGVYGSAFGLTLNDALDKGLKPVVVDVLSYKIKLPVAFWVKTIIDAASKKVVTEKNIRDKRIEWNHVRLKNYSIGMTNSLLKSDQTIDLFDGGIAFNIPFPLLTDRKDRAVDVIIVYDSNPGDVDSLHDFTKYCKRKKISMPDMSATTKQDVMSRVMTVFNDPRMVKTYNKNQPTILYFPTPVDVKKPPYITMNFKYTKTDIQHLMDVVHEAFESQVLTMKKILKMVAAQRHA